MIIEEEQEISMSTFDDKKQEKPNLADVLMKCDESKLRDISDRWFFHQVKITYLMNQFYDF